MKDGWEIVEDNNEERLYLVEQNKYSKQQFTVKLVGIWGKRTVLAGQEKITFIENFDTEEEARDKYPDIELVAEDCFRNTYDHLKD